MPAVRRRLLSVLACLAVVVGPTGSAGAASVAEAGLQAAAPSGALADDGPPGSADGELAPPSGSPSASPSGSPSGPPTPASLDGVPVVVPRGVPVVERAADVPVDVFLVPHQDDELLTMGAAVHAAVRAGHHVWVTSYMTGGGSSVCSQVRGTCTRGRWRGVPVTVFSADRDAELSGSLAALGVPPDHLLRDPGTGGRVLDGYLTPALAAVVVGTALARFPGATVTSMSFVDAHPDHRLVGVELRRAVEDGVLAPELARFAMYRVYWQWAPARRIAPDGTVMGDARAWYRLAYGAPQDAVLVRCTSRDGCAEALADAAASYAAPYGIGRASVGPSFDSLAAAPGTLLHTWATQPYDVGALAVRSSGATAPGEPGDVGDAVEVRGVCAVRPAGRVDAAGLDDPDGADGLAGDLADAVDAPSSGRVLPGLGTVTLTGPGSRPVVATARWGTSGTWRATVPRAALGRLLAVRCAAPGVRPATVSAQPLGVAVTVRLRSGATTVTSTVPAAASGSRPAAQVCVPTARGGGLTGSFVVTAATPSGIRAVVTPVRPGRTVSGGVAVLVGGRPVAVPFAVGAPVRGARYGFRLSLDVPGPLVAPAPVSVTVCAR